MAAVQGGHFLLCLGVMIMKTGYEQSSYRCRGVTLGEGGVGGSASLAEADGGAVVGLSFLGAQGLHGRVGRPEPDERGGHPGGLVAVQHHFLQGRGFSQEFEIPLDGSHVVLGVDAAQGGVLIQ